MLRGFLRPRDAEAEALERSLQHAAVSHQDTPWLNGVFRPLLIALVASSLAAGPVALLRALSPWPLLYVLPLAFLLSLEAVYATRQLGRPSWRYRGRLAFRLGEVLGLLIVVRLAVWLFGTGLPGPAAVLGWLDDPGSFFDPQFEWTIAVFALCWWYAGAMTLDFMDLAIQPDEMLAREIRLEFGSSGAEHAHHGHSRSEIMGGFLARWIGCAILMIFLAAATRLNVRTGEQGLLRITLQGAGLAGDVLAGLLVYFVAGFMLIGEGRLAVLRGGWYNEDLAVGRDVIRRWQVMVFATLLAAGALAALLPLGSTVGLSYGLGYLLALVLRLLLFLIAILTILVGILLWPFHLLLAPGGSRLPPPETLLRQVPDQQQVLTSLPPWLGGALFWAAIIVVTGYLLVVNWRGRAGSEGGLRGGRFERLRFWWRALWARLWGRAQAAGAAVRARLASVGPPRPAIREPRGPGLRPGSLPPRARVRYFYLSTIQRAEQRGIVRPPQETPSEFAGELGAHLPDAEDDVAALTEAFIAARYADEPIPTEQAHTVQPIWQRLMAAIGRGGRRDG